MIKYFYISLYICLSFTSSAQSNEHQPEPLDSNTFLFEFDLKYIGSNTRIDDNYQYVLEFLIESLEKNPSWTIHVRGHVCCGPSKKISGKRACNVYKYLIKNGIEESRVTYKGYSDEKPIVFPEKTSEDEKKNRRVDFIISK